MNLEQAKPPLVCANCGKTVAEHVRRPYDALRCKDGKSWKHTDEYEVWDTLRQLENIDARRERLTAKLARLTKQPWAQDAALLADANAWYSEAQREEMGR